MTSPLATATQLSQLENEYGILHMLYHRSRNQHRVAVWWKYLNILHRRVRIILKLLYDSRHTIDTLKIAKKNREIIDNVRYLNRKGLVRSAYFHFHSILALGQFVSLGFSLIASLSKISELLGDICGKEVAILEYKVPNRANDKTGVVMDSGEELGEELGEEVGEDYEECEYDDVSRLSIQKHIHIENDSGTVSPGQSTGTRKDSSDQKSLLMSRKAAETVKPTAEARITSHEVIYASDSPQKRPLEQDKPFSSHNDNSASGAQSIDDIFGSKKLKKLKTDKKKTEKKKHKKKTQSSIDSIFGNDW